jgi:hypothetical protein
MATKIEDFKNQVLLQTSLFPATITATGDGTSVDMIDADGRCFAVQTVGSVSGTSPSMSGKIQESSDGSTWVDIANATFTAVTAASNVQSIVFDRTRRFLRHTRTVSGTSPVLIMCVQIGEQKKLL